MRFILLANNIFITNEMIRELNITNNDYVIIFGKYFIEQYNLIRSFTQNIYLFLRCRSRDDTIKWHKVFIDHQNKNKDRLFTKIFFVTNHLNDTLQKQINKIVNIIDNQVFEIVCNDDLYKKAFSINFQDKQPTTGIICLEYLLNKNISNIILFGFTQELRIGGKLWSGHNCDLEKEIIDGLVQQNRIYKYYCKKIETNNKINQNLKKIDRLKLKYKLINQF